MAEVNTGDDGGGKKKHGKKRAKKSSTRIDMTPMVDLGFLLLTFFILTTTFNKPQAMEINMPVKDKIEDEKKNKVPAEHTLSLLLTDKNVVYWYFGVADPSKPLPSLTKTNYSKDGIRKLLITENNKRHNAFNQIEQWKKELAEKKITEDEFIEKKKVFHKQYAISSLIVLLKPDKDSNYKNIVDALDEMAICNIGSYALLESNDLENQMIANANTYK
ncbi:MAG TPA: biopolymer transporter ExbD [Flavobacteriales bacterium]|nr:biopolymer transporter ExbD [Flavobacteriales bacterium]